MSPIYKSEEGERLVKERYREILTRWPVANEQLHLPTREGETFVIACGPKDAPPVLLFHGAVANSVTWMGDVAAWAEHFRTFAVDMIGEGGLSAPSRPPLDSDAYALWLDDVLEGLSLDKVSIIGLSLGGWLALDYATRRPGRANALVLLCPGGVGRQKSGYLLKVLPLLLFGQWGRRKAAAIALGPMDLPDPERARVGLEFFNLVSRNMKPRYDRLPIFSDDALRQLKIPLLAILGGLDVILDSDETKKRLEANVPTAEVIYLPKIGHAVVNQTQRVLDFLRRALSA
jgi:pimeloyl-ACP methyl ester carboxylesterase